jgi:hypothetical protein
VSVILVKLAKNHSAKGINRGSLILIDLAATRSDVKAEEILYHCQVWNVQPFAETVLPGARLTGDGEASLERVILYF